MSNALDSLTPTGEVEQKLAPRTLAGVPVNPVSQRADWIKMLVYGVPGAGKTLLCASAADVKDMTPILFIDIEGGTKVFRKKYPNIDVLRVQDQYNSVGHLVKSAWMQLFEVYEALKKGGAKGYKTIVIDSLTEAQKVSMYSVMAALIDTRPDRDPDIPDKREWGKSGEMLRRMVRSFRDLNAHVLFTALDTEIKNTEGYVTGYRPDLPGKLAVQIPAFMDECYYLYIKPNREGVVERKILCQPTDKYQAKSRADLPTVITDPTMAKIAKLVLT